MIRLFILIILSFNAFSLETTGMVSFENRYFKNDDNLATKDQGFFAGVSTDCDNRSVWSEC